MGRLLVLTLPVFEFLKNFGIFLKIFKDALENYSPPVEQKNNSKGDDDSPEDKLNKLAELKEKGLITDEDYNAKKEEILKNM